MAKRRRSNPRRRQPSAPKPNTQMVDASSQWLTSAHLLWRQGAHQDALALYREAIRQEPNNVRAYVMTARAFAQKFQFDRMEEVHDRLIRRAPRHPGVHHYIGETYGMLKLPAKALASYKQASNLPGAGAPTWMELASLYEQAHRLEEARELIERTVRSGFDLPLVGLVRARIQRRLGDTSKAISMLHALIEKFPAASQWVCQAWGELALMKDRQGDYDGAFEAIENCKQIQRQRDAAYWKASEKTHAVMRVMIDQIAKHDFLQWRDAAADLPSMRLALLTGFPRSGTTLLEQLLDAHPELVSSEERDFIGNELFQQVSARQGSKPLLDILNDVPVKRIASERERYLPVMEYLLGESIDGRVHLDKNPAYNLTIPLLLRFFPETRLIVALRDPRDVILSCYLRYLPLNSVSVRFLTVERAADRYALDMRAWLKFRELIETSWCEIRYEDTVDDLAKQARRALEMLGLDWSDQVLDYRTRLGQEKRVTSPTYEAVAQPVHKQAIGRWKNYERHLAPVFEKLEPFIREFDYD